MEEPSNAYFTANLCVFKPYFVSCLKMAEKKKNERQKKRALKESNQTKLMIDDDEAEDDLEEHTRQGK